MISSEDVHFFWVLDFVSVEQTDGLNALSSSINIIAQKQVIGLRRETTIFEESQHIVELAMNIAAYF